MPDPLKVLNTIKRATELTRDASDRIGGIEGLDEDAGEVLVVGDLHGHVHTFATSLSIAKLDRYPNRHMVFQELIHDPRINPETEMDLSHRLVDLVCALKCQYPRQTHVILGNHELSELTGRAIGKGGVLINELFHRGVERSYGTHAPVFLRAYKAFFAVLPLAVRTANRVLVCHTLPNGPSLDELDMKLVFEARSWPDEATQRGGTIYALTWGRDTSPETADRFAAMIDADLFVCGHQPCDNGFFQANHRVLILDGTGPSGSYCLFPARGPITIEGLVAGARCMVGPREPAAASPLSDGVSSEEEEEAEEKASG